MLKLFSGRSFLNPAWIKPVCLILIIVGAVFFFAHEQAKSLFRSDCNKLRAIEDRWTEAGHPSGTNLDMFVEEHDDFIVNTQVFLVGTQKLQAQFTIRNPRINWKGGQLFVTTNKVLILHTETEDRIVHWTTIWPCFDFVKLEADLVHHNNGAETPTVP
jgi:hypothetical protein